MKPEEVTKELLKLSTNEPIEIHLHLPEYEGMRLLMVGGAITTREGFEHFEDSLCHLYADGRVLRFGIQIGTESDIEVISWFSTQFAGLCRKGE